VVCAGHKAEGYGLSWSHLREGHLLSGSDDTLVCTWDINAMPRDGRVRKVNFQAPSSTAEDAAQQASGRCL
jgi:hypothetical protein